ncbi:MAG: hypothetical protein K2H09_05155 [Treponemataceae bacterium]|nr:hypothetical protein [Treponemataceae bacterium]
MKKAVLVFLSVFFTAGILFAQSEVSALPDESDTVDLSTKIIVPENQHTTDKTAKVKIEYIPMFDEVRIYYTCMYVTYDAGEAMNSVLACLEDFTKENRYYHYKYMERDKVRYYKDDRGVSWAQYISHVKFSR